MSKNIRAVIDRDKMAGIGCERTFFLSDKDLPQEHQQYLTEMSIPEFKEYFNDLYKIHGRIDLKGYLTRIFIVLPFAVHRDENIYVIPIPFVVDTGAPVMLILGRGAEKELKDKRLIKKAYTQFYGDFNYLDGYLLYGSKPRYIHKPVISNRTTNMEDDKLWDQKRVNLLGLKALGELGININLSEVVKDCHQQQAELNNAPNNI